LPKSANILVLKAPTTMTGMSNTLCNALSQSIISWTGLFSKKQVISAIPLQPLNLNPESFHSIFYLVWILLGGNIGYDLARDYLLSASFFSRLIMMESPKSDNISAFSSRDSKLTPLATVTVTQQSHIFKSCSLTL